MKEKSQTNKISMVFNMSNIFSNNYWCKNINQKQTIGIIQDWVTGDQGI